VDDQDYAAVELEVRAALARGDANAAATAVLRALGPEIYGFLVAMHREEQDASDTFSAFSEGVWKSLPAFKWGSSLRTWAYTIARNVLASSRRVEYRKKRREEPATPSFLDAAEDVLRTATLTYLRTESRSELERLRDELPPEDRALLVLRVDRKLAWNDLARVLAAEPLEDDATVAREAARLRKRFQLVKDRLRASAKAILGDRDV
jgi:RNA polymerase sigma-70 factor (ECF subfamily)